ncbi:hypothetical protein ACR3K2_34500 [Cryptosporidium serpentis]
MGSFKWIKKKRDDFLFSWNRRRYSYRMGWYFARLCIVSVVIILLSFILFFLQRSISCKGTKCGYFMTFACSPWQVTIISSSIIALGSICSIQAALSWVLSRLLYNFANYRTTDFMALGKWASLLGALVKHIPFIIAACTISVGIICIFGIIYILAANVCQRSFLPHTQILVNNCRLYNAKCIYKPTMNDILQCNNPNYIVSSNFLQMRCSPGVNEICSFVNKTMEGKNPCPNSYLGQYLLSKDNNSISENIISSNSNNSVNITEEKKHSVDKSSHINNGSSVLTNSPYISSIEGIPEQELLSLYLLPIVPSSISELTSSTGFSDLYSVSRLWIAVATFIFLSTTLVFIFIKVYSPQDSCFSFVRKSNEFILLKVLNVFTPWQ